MPPPRTHRLRYFGVLTSISSLTAAVTALATPAQPAQPAKQVVVLAEPANMSKGALGVVPLGHASLPTPEPRASQTFTGALPVGGVDRPHL